MKPSHTVRSPSGASGRTGGGGEPGRGVGVSASAAAVIKGWSDALREGDPQRGAAYWALPSVMINGPDVAGRFSLIHIRTVRDALMADETLSCAATLLSTSRSGEYVKADFMLSARAGSGTSSGCRGPASVDFVIRNAHIVRWLRAPLASGPPPPGSREPGQGAGSQSI